MGRRLRLAVVAVSAVVGLSAPAGAATPGPALETDPLALETALSCPDGLTHPGRSVVLLVHGTATTSEESWPDGLGAVLPAAGFDWCMVDLPGRAMGDIQASTEYVVAAVRLLHERTARKVSLVGHSQGARESRWAVQWWPDVRAAVDDLVSVAGNNRGLPYLSAPFCRGGCAPAFWQQGEGSRFNAALNQVQALPEPDYSSVYSLTDDLAQPSFPPERAVATIDGAANIAVQNICPGRPVGHVQMIYDAATTAVVLDALTHGGPADPARIDRAVCSALTPPGVDPAIAASRTAALYANALRTVWFAPRTDAEPPLRDYASRDV